MSTLLVDGGGRLGAASLLALRSDSTGFQVLALVRPRRGTSPRDTQVRRR